MAITKDQILAELIAQTAISKTVAPRDIATSLIKKSADPSADWRSILPIIKKVSIEAEENGEIVFWRKGKIVPSKGIRGVYRLAKAPTDDVCDHEKADTTA